MRVRDLASDPDLARRAVAAFPPLGQVVGPLPEPPPGPAGPARGAPIIGAVSCEHLDMGAERLALLRLRIDRGLDDGTTEYSRREVVHVLEDGTRLALERDGRDMALVGCMTPEGDVYGDEELAFYGPDLVLSIDESLEGMEDEPADEGPEPEPGPLAPWAMTLAEFVASGPDWVERRPEMTYAAWAAPRGYPCPLEDQGDLRHPHGISKAERRRIGDRAQRRLALLREGQDAYDAAVRSGEIGTIEIREPIDASTTMGQARARVLHRRAIRGALSLGLPVPAAVLADHPGIEAPEFPDDRAGCTDRPASPGGPSRG